MIVLPYLYLPAFLTLTQAGRSEQTNKDLESDCQSIHRIIKHVNEISAVNPITCSNTDATSLIQSAHDRLWIELLSRRLSRSNEAAHMDELFKFPL